MNEVMKIIYELAGKRPSTTGEEPMWPVDVFELERRVAVLAAPVATREDVVRDADWTQIAKLAKELEKALSDLIECHDAFEASVGNMEEAYYKLAKYARPQWNAARALFKEGETR